ncbi:MAG: hemerythrin domain-containing protein [Chloroflexi bacterium]|nr:hemerythrin domain-containing protein [Chloroflexota bacterium]
MSTPFDDFRAHHKGIAAELEAMEQTVEALTPRNMKSKAGDLGHIVHFLLDDLTPHAQAEEGVLYPPAEGLIKQHGKAIAPLELEHRTLEALISQFHDLAESLPIGDAETLHSLQQVAHHISFLVRLHIEKEEKLVLPLLEEHLSPAEQQGIMHRMHGHG